MVRRKIGNGKFLLNEKGSIFSIFSFVRSKLNLLFQASQQIIPLLYQFSTLNQTQSLLSSKKIHIVYILLHLSHLWNLININIFVLNILFWFHTLPYFYIMNDFFDVWTVTIMFFFRNSNFSIISSYSWYYRWIYVRIANVELAIIKYERLISNESFSERRSIWLEFRSSFRENLS